MAWLVKRSASSDRKTTVVAVRITSAAHCLRRLDLEEGRRPASGRRFRDARLAGNLSGLIATLLKYGNLLNPKAKKLGNVRDA